MVPAAPVWRSDGLVAAPLCTLSLCHSVYRVKVTVWPVTVTLCTVALSHCHCLHSHTFTLSLSHCEHWKLGTQSLSHCPCARGDSVTQTQTVPHHGDCDTVCMSLSRCARRTQSRGHSIFCCLRASVAGWLHTVTVAQAHYAVTVLTQRVKSA